MNRVNKERDRTGLFQLQPWLRLISPFRYLSRCLFRYLVRYLCLGSCLAGFMLIIEAAEVAEAAEAGEERQQSSDSVPAPAPVETEVDSGGDTQGPRSSWHRAAVIPSQLSRQREFAAEQRNLSIPDEQIWQEEGQGKDPGKDSGKDPGKVPNEDQGPDPEEQTLMLYRAALSQPARGVLVVLFSRQQPFDGNPLRDTQAGIRVALPRHGWSTLSLALPDPVQLLMAPRESEDWQRQNEERLQRDRKRIAQRLAAAQKLATTRSKGGKLIWVASGEGAAWLAWYLSGGVVTVPDAGAGDLKDEARGRQRRAGIDGLVLIDAQPDVRIPHPVPGQPPLDESEPVPLPETTYVRLRAFDLPLLILQHDSHPWPGDLVLPGRGELHRLPGRGADQTLVRSLRGWLKRQTS